MSQDGSTVVKVKDNFLTEENFKRVKDLVLDYESNFGWGYSDGVVNSDDIYFQFVHMLYSKFETRSPYCWEIFNIFSLNPLALFRIKANMLTRSQEIIKSDFHVDYYEDKQDNLDGWLTSIFYLNTNNGYTEWEDGTIVKSVGNRFATFPGKLAHRGTTCTDEKVRVVINFNYFP